MGNSKLKFKNCIPDSPMSGERNRVIGPFPSKSFTRSPLYEARVSLFVIYIVQAYIVVAGYDNVKLYNPT